MSNPVKGGQVIDPTTIVRGGLTQQPALTVYTRIE